MTKLMPGVAISGLIFCLLYFTSAIAILISSGSGVLMQYGTSIFSREYFLWQKSAIGTFLLITQNVLFILIWVHIIFFLRKYKEYLFISMVIGVHLLWSLYTAIFDYNSISLGVKILITSADALLLIISLWLIKHPHLRGFARGYTIAAIGEFLLARYLFPWLYDNLSIHWLNFNPIIMNLIPYSVLAIMFLSIWVRSRNIVPIEYSAPLP